MQDLINKYVNLLVKKGLNVQKDESVLIFAPVEMVDFVRLLVQECYENDAKNVIVEWNDDILKSYDYKYKDLDAFNSIADYVVQKYHFFENENFSFIRLTGNDPHVFENVDSQKMMAETRTYSKNLDFFIKAQMSDKLKWCVAGVPTLKWAQKVFPDSEDPVTSLWESILDTVRVNDNAIDNWTEHIVNLRSISKYLNELSIDSLHFTNSLGTDLVVGLPERYKFISGESINQNNQAFIANIPTEEIFTAPDFRRVDGIVYSSKPLNYRGILIDDFYLKFEAGKVVEVNAQKNQEVLEQLVNADEGASQLGELALVDYDSPISLANVLYYNTLYDENASCHLALGKAYPTCVENGANLTKEELLEQGINNSAIHVDFMFGTKDLQIRAKLKDGSEVQVFKDGNFVF